MTETVNETKTVRTYRHEALDSLKAARDALRVGRDNEQVEALRDSLNGHISEILAGRPGYSQREQVKRLSKAGEHVSGTLDGLDTTALKETLKAGIDELVDGVAAKVQAAVETLTEGADFAANRDFEAWQAAKGRPVGTYDSTEGNEVDDEDEAEDEEV